MDNAEQIVRDGLIFFANGALVLAYFLAERAAHLAAIAVALVIAATFDRLIQSQAVFAPRRYEDGAVRPSQAPRTAQVITGIAIGLWLAATWTFQSFVPAIGAAMWLASLLALLVMPQQRWSLLWSTKGYLILYSLAVIGFRLYLWQTARLSPQDLALVFGGAEPAARILAQNTGSFATVGSWLVWAILPAGYFALLLQNWLAQPMGVVGPMQGAEEVVRALRTRGVRTEQPGR
jgi:hypothetical protein